MNFNFGEVLSRAWQITWKHKVLWIFGLLASCASGGGNSSSSSFQQSNPYSGNNPFTPEMTRQITEFFQRLGIWIFENQWAIYAFIISIGLLIILQLFLATVGQTGLIRGAYHADGGAEKLHFGMLGRESLRFFWRVTGLGFLVWGPFFALLVIIVAGFIYGGELYSSPGDLSPGIAMAVILSFISMCCCLLPIIFVLSFYFRQALSALLVENIGVFDSLARGWNVIVKHFGELFIMGLIMFGIGIAFGIILAIPVFIVVIPLTGAFIEGSIRSWTPLLIAFVALLAYTPVSLFLNSIYRTFSESVWTLTYMRLTQEPDTGEGLSPVTDTPQSPEDSDKTILAVHYA